MEFIWSGTGIFLGIVAFVIFLVIWGVTCSIYKWGTGSYYYEEKSTPKRKLGPIRVILFGLAYLVPLYVIANFITYTSSEGARPESVVTAKEAIAAEYGLVSGKSYDLMLGERIDGVSGEGHFRWGRGSFEMNTASSILVSYFDGQNDWPLNIPLNSEFKTQPEVDPSIYVEFNEAEVSWAEYLIDVGPCRVVIDAGWWNCEKESTKRLVVPSNYGELSDEDKSRLADNGAFFKDSNPIPERAPALIDLAAEHLKFAELTLSDSAYQQIITGG